MDNIGKGKIPDRFSRIYRFYLIVLCLLTGFLMVELLISEYLLTSPLTFFEMMIPSTILYMAFIIFTMMYAQRTQMSSYEMGFHSFYVPKSILIGFLATSGYLIVALVFQMPLNYPARLDIFMIGCFSVLIGLTEEAMFRGYIQASYQREVSQFKAILLTGLLFAFLHIPSYIISGAYLNIISVPSLILVGLLLGFIRIHTGNIWGVIVIHTTWNYYQFLFTPVITESTPIEALIPVLASSLAMWGTLVLSMFVSKSWIDRPTQMPAELDQEFSTKINNLGEKIWKLQNEISSIRIQFPHSSKITVFSNRIKMYNEHIEAIKRYIPQINEKNYKILKKLIPLELKAIKFRNLMSITQYPPRLALLNHKKTLLESEINSLKSVLGKIV